MKKLKAAAEEIFEEVPSFEGHEFYGVYPRLPSAQRKKKAPKKERMDDFTRSISEFFDGKYYDEEYVNLSPKGFLCSPFIAPGMTQFTENNGGNIKCFKSFMGVMLEQKVRFVKTEIRGKKYRVALDSDECVFFITRGEDKFAVYGINNSKSLRIFTNKEYEECFDLAEEIFTCIVNDFIKGTSFEVTFKHGYRGTNLNFKMLDKPKVTFDDIILKDEIKEKFRFCTINVVKQIGKLVEHGALRNRGIIIYGTHGTGKTSLIKAMINEIYGKFSVIMVRTGNMDPEEIESIYEIATEIAPVFVVMEDIDRILFGAGDAEGIVSSLLNVMDGYRKTNGIITIATSNHADKIDLALRDRPGRFDTTILIPRPTNDEFKKIISLDLGYIEKDVMALKEDFTDMKIGGAHAKKLITDALLIACNDGRDIVSIADLKKSISWMRAERQEFGKFGKDDKMYN